MLIKKRGKVMNLKNFLRKGNNLYYCIYTLILLIAHIFLPLNWADDAVFMKKAAEKSIADFLSTSARPLTDAMTYFFARNPVIWELTDPIILLILVLLICKYFKLNSKKEKVFVSIAVLFPSLAMVDAGFIATTLNYLWSVTLGFLCLLPSWKVFNNEKVRWYEKLLLLPLLLYAANMQQMSVILTVLLGLSCIIMTVKRKSVHINYYIFFQLAITVGCVAYSYYLNIFGENSRMIRETARYFPDFGSLNILQKIELGFSSTFFGMTMNLHLPWSGFFAFVSWLLYASLRKGRSIKQVITAAFPVIFSIFGLLQAVLPQRYRFLSELLPGGLKNWKLDKAIYSFEPVSDIFFLLVILCVVCSLWFLFDSKKYFALSIFTLAVGTGSRLMMGFSPTVWASGCRSYYIMFISMIIVSALIINQNYTMKKSLKI